MTMTPREQVLTILKGGRPDQVPWLGDLSYWYHYLAVEKKLAPEHQGEDGIYRLHRDLGVGFYLQGHFPYKTDYRNVQLESSQEGDNDITMLKTPAGDIRQVWTHLADSYCSAPSEHYVKDWRDLAALRHWYAGMAFEPDYECARRRQAMIGDNGITLCFLPKSPLMDLVALHAGIEALTYIQLEAPDELQQTLAVMRAANDRAAQIAVDSPAETLMIPENLSSEVVGANLFERCGMRDYETHWNARIKSAGKFSFVHIDGTMKGLIRQVAATGFSVLEALTPAPVGDIPMDEIHRWVDGDNIIWGGLPGVYFTDLIRDADFDRFVISVLEVMVTKPRYVLGVADQIPPHARHQRVARVRELVDKYGKY
jgi:hypothetical protein